MDGETHHHSSQQGRGSPCHAQQRALTHSRPDLLLVIFIHGFKGNNTTFGGFPSRLQYVLSETIENVKAECILFPAYETKGELDAAVERFVEWLSNLTAEKESELAAATGNNAKIKIVLCGHSMGGLLAADTLLALCKSRSDNRSPIWPNIIACIAFDTPYFGIHPFVFKNSATKAIEYAQVARNVTTGLFGSLAGFGAAKTIESVANKKPATSSSWGKLTPSALMVGGAALLAGAAGTAYYKRDDIGTGYTWIMDHMQYVRSLWNQEMLNKRMDDMMTVEEQLGVRFRVFYANLPPAPPTHRSERTFILLPPISARSYSYFWPSRNRLASDELGAHTGMFGAKSNDGFYELGLQTALFIRDAVMMGRGVIHSENDMIKPTEDCEFSGVVVR